MEETLMKRFLSLLLCALMIFSAVSVVYAQEPDENGEVEVLDAEKVLEVQEEDGFPDYEPFVPEGLDKAIIGPDDRIVVRNPKEYPYSAIARMIVKGKCGHQWECSGFMVSKNFLMTAGHCVICTECKQWAKSITFYFGYKSSKSYALKYTGKWRAWAGDIFVYGERMDLDYAYIKLDQNIGDKVGWFGISALSDSNMIGERISVAGYRDGILKIDTGYMEPYDANVLLHNVDTVGGNSGCPIYDSSYYAVAIHIAGNYYNREVSDAGSVNYGRRITRNLYSFMKDAGFK